jgi:aryl-alcohol dehydrogenase-like predicted oxidoreductase
MHKVEIAGISSSVLGFGCASVLGAVGGGRATRALHCALDCGINHFDLARSYGYGEAEQFVGKLLKDRRKELVLVSKFGIKANFNARLLSPLKPLMRLVKNNRQPVSNANTTIVNAVTVADRFHNRIAINPAQMQASLETSLKQLGTDYLDHFLVHEPLNAIINADELFYAADKLKTAGKIRSFGIAFTTNQYGLHQHYLNRFDVLQFNKPNTLADDIDITAKQGAAANILFSIMSNRPAGLTHQEMLKQLTVDFPKSVLLCAMFNEEHIKQNARILS